MNASAPLSKNERVPLGIGYYTAPEAGRLLRVPPRSINRWLGGYAYTSHGVATEMPPLWRPELPAHRNRIELSFRDLIELRFIHAFLQAGLGLKAVRNCITTARDCVQDDRPFSTRRFRTDGRTIFLESLRQSGTPEVLDLKQRQYAFRDVIERTFKDLDLTDEAVTRWRPFGGKPSIVIDPTRSFGQPIAMESGVPTVALAEAVTAEGSVERAAFLYDAPPRVVRDALDFETSLRAA